MTTSSSAQATPPVGAVASEVTAAAVVLAEGARAVATLSEMAGRVS